MKFPYRRYRESNDPPNAPLRVRPSIPARVIGLSSSAMVYGLLDTGGTLTLLDESFIDLLDVRIRKGDHTSVLSVSGHEFRVLFGMVDIELAHSGHNQVHRWSARIGFMQNLRGGAIFGHAGFLDHFVVSFHGPKQHVTLRPRVPLPEPRMSVP